MILDDVVVTEDPEEATSSAAEMLGLLEAEAGPTLDDLDLVGHPVGDELVDGQGARHPDRGPAHAPATAPAPRLP